MISAHSDTQTPRKLFSPFSAALPWVILCCGLFLTSFLFFHAQQSTQALAQQYFERTASLRSAAIEYQFKTMSFEFATLVRFFSESENVTQDEFRDFTESLWSVPGGLSAAFWIPIDPQKPSSFPISLIAPVEKFSHWQALDLGANVPATLLLQPSSSWPDFPQLFLIPSFLELQRPFFLIVQPIRKLESSGVLLGLIDLQAMARSDAFKDLPQGVFIDLLDLSQNPQQRLVTKGEDTFCNSAWCLLEPVPESYQKVVVFEGRRFEIVIRAGVGYFSQVLVPYYWAFWPLGLGITLLLTLTIRRVQFKRIVAEKIADKLTRDLRRKEEHLLTTLRSIGDAIITTDVKGLITQINPVAERLTEWSQEEARGQPLTTVFRIINEMTREPILNPVQRVFREGRIIGLSNHTILIAKSGRECAIDESGAPVIGESGQIEGAVLVFRDVTEERLNTKALLDSEKKFRSFFSNMHEGVALHKIMYGTNGLPVNYIITDVNPRYEEILGRSRDEVVGRLATDVYQQSTAPYLEEFCTILGTGKANIFETFFAPLKKHFHITVIAYAPGCFATVFLDITEEKTKAEALRESTARFQSLVASIPGTVYRCKNDPDRSIDYLSEGVTDLTGYPVSDFLGGVRTYASIIHPDDRQKVFEEVQKAVSSQKSYAMEYQVITKDGAVRHVFEQGEGIFDGQGALVCLEGVFVDSTPLFLAREAVAQERDRAKQYLDIAGVILLALDREGKITRANKMAADLLGYSEEELLGKDWFIHFVPEPQRDQVSTFFSLAMQGTHKIPHEYENFIQTHSGEQRLIFWRNILLKDDQGKILGTLSSGEDITLSKRIEDGLQGFVQAFADRSQRLVFNNIASALATTLRLDEVLIGEYLAEKKAVRVIGNTINGAEAEPFEYCLEGTPCRDVIGKELFVCPKDVKLKFPNDIFLSQHNISGYLGVPLFSSMGRPLGIIVGLTRAALQDIELLKPILNVFARSVEAEIERYQAAEALRENEDRMKLALDAANEAIWDWVLGGKIYFSPRYYRMLGFDPWELESSYDSFKELLHPDDRERVDVLMNKYYTQGAQDHSVEFRIRTKNGDYRWILSRGKVVERAADGSPIRIVGTHTDITDKKQSQEALAQERNLLRTLVDNLPDSIYLKDMAGRKLLSNRADLDFIGAKDEKDVLGKTDAEVFAPALADQFNRDDKIVLTSGRPIINREEIVEGASGIRRWLLTSKLPLRDLSGVITGLIGIGRDITDRKVLETKLLTMAHYDTLTALPNRTLFFEKATSGIANARRSNTPCAILFIDLDHFKSVNDTMGHSVGDELLKDTAIRIAECVRESDTMARLGGDEFIVFLSHLEDGQQAQTIAERIREKLNAPRLVSGHDLFITASVGIAVFPGDGDTLEDLLKNSDTAMYAAKESGRNVFCFFDHLMNQKAVTKMQIERGLRDALIKNEFRLMYQPIVSVKDNKIRGFEALIRWFPSEGGLVFPDEFIPVAEETGLIIPMGEWVLQEACRFARHLIDSGHGQCVVSVNLSVAQLRRKNIVETIENTLKESRVPASNLEIEVTESILIGSFDTALDVLHKINNIGVRISLDDFGTGYSSLSHLQRLPITHLKIDRLFINEIAKTQSGHTLTPAIIDLAHKLNLVVIAEGVETKEQLALLAKYNCDLYQGFVLSKALPQDQVLALWNL